MVKGQPFTRLPTMQSNGRVIYGLLKRVHRYQLAER